MSTIDMERTLAEWFEADALAPVPDDLTDRVLDGVRRRTPRRAWLAAPGSHWGWDHAGSTPRVRLAPGLSVSWWTAIILLVALAIVLGGAIVVGSRMLVSPSLPAAPAALMAYAADGDIFVADRDGGNVVRIADGLPGGKPGCGSAGYWAEGPMWSPDGRHLAYRSPRDQVTCDLPAADMIPTVIISDPAGVPVAEFPGVGWRIAWSPNSTRLATWLDSYPMTRIGVYGLDGVREAEITLPSSISDAMPGDYDPMWSPDGASLLVPTRRQVDGSGTEMNEVWELPIDGGPPQLVPADDPRSHWMSVRSPEGSRIAYVDDETLFVVAPDDSEPRPLVTGILDAHVNRPAWSPAGDRIAIVAGGSDAEVDTGGGVFESRRDNTTTELVVIDATTGERTSPVPAGLGDGMSVITFSAEGDQILFARYDAEGSQSLWSVNLDGSSLRELVGTDAGSGLVNGDWAPSVAQP